MTKKENKDRYYFRVHFYDELKNTSVYQKAISYKKRDIFPEIRTFFLNEDNDPDLIPRVGVLYGLKGTGKTTLMYQLIESLSSVQKEKTAFINIHEHDDFLYLMRVLDKLYENNYRYIFINEITRNKDFIDMSSVLSNSYALDYDMRIIISGTDYFNFAFSFENPEQYSDFDYEVEYLETEEQYIMFHTNKITFDEFTRLTGISDIKEYIRCSGTFNLKYDEHNRLINDNFRNIQETRRYVDRNIGVNIENTLDRYRFGRYYSIYGNPHDMNDTVDLINRLLENHDRTLFLEVLKKYILKKLENPENLKNIENPKKKEHGILNVINDLKEKEMFKYKKIEEFYIAFFGWIFSAMDVVKESRYIEDKYIITIPALRYAYMEELLEDVWKYGSIKCNIDKKIISEMEKVIINLISKETEEVNQNETI